jgi:adenosylhomocysteine nucleosidase
MSLQVARSRANRPSHYKAGFSKPQRRPATRLFVALLLWSTLATGCSSFTTSRSWTAVVGATEEEVAALKAELDKVARFEAPQHALGITFSPFTVRGSRGVLFGSGMSMVNAAYAMQLAFDRYPIGTVIVGGTAGGVSPELQPGDVVVPERWHHHSEAVYLNERQDGDGFILRDGFVPPHENFGFMFPRPVQVTRAGMAGGAPGLPCAMSTPGRSLS